MPRRPKLRATCAAARVKAEARKNAPLGGAFSSGLRLKNLHDSIFHGSPSQDRLSLGRQTLLVPARWSSAIPPLRSFEAGFVRCYRPEPVYGALPPSGHVDDTTPEPSDQAL